jgi:hypothetical protein
MIRRLITHEMVEQALHVLSTTAEQTAAARAIRLRAEFRRKRVRARLIAESNEKSAAARDAYAEASDAYAIACEEEAKAVEQDEFLRASRNDAAVILESWRTEEASHRAGASFK